MSHNKIRLHFDCEIVILIITYTSISKSEEGLALFTFRNHKIDNELAMEKEMQIRLVSNN